MLTTFFPCYFASAFRRGKQVRRDKESKDSAVLASDSDVEIVDDR